MWQQNVSPTARLAQNNPHVIIVGKVQAESAEPIVVATTTAHVPSASAHGSNCGTRKANRQFAYKKAEQGRQRILDGCGPKARKARSEQGGGPAGIEAEK